MLERGAQTLTITFMKNAILGITMLLGLLFAFPANAQKKKTTEIGVVTSNLQDFSLNLKRGKNNRYRRYRLFTANAGSSSFLTSDNSNWQIGTSVGLAIMFEKRKTLSNRVSVLHGPELSLAGSISESHDSPDPQVAQPTGTRRSQNWTIRPGFGWRIGMMYNILDNLYCSAEIAPQFQYNIQRNQNWIEGETRNDPSWRYSSSLNLSTGIQFGLFYRFGVKPTSSGKRSE